MNRVIQIAMQLKQLELEVIHLKKELMTIQNMCKHEFQTNNSIQKCTKCNFIESLYW